MPTASPAPTNPLRSDHSGRPRPPIVLIGLTALLSVAAFAAIAFLVWASTPALPSDRAVAALETDATVAVETGEWITFRPTAGEPRAGLVVYPGGRIDPRAYAPLARAVASEGYLVVIVPMPLGLAFFAHDRAREVVAAHPEVRHWAVGGHSLGGAMAARHLYLNSDAAQGLVLWAGYPAESDSLADRDLAVVSISGSNDGLATRGKIDASRPLLPSSTVWVEIAGGNHAQFGSYGPQPGDNAASIGQAEQQAAAAAATVTVLARIAAR